MKKLVLPKKYELDRDNPQKEFEKFVGLPKISYSQYTSWGGGYRGQYIAGYFLGIKTPSNIFADFGSMCGEYLEKLDKADLSKKDIEILDSIKSPRDAEYEREIVIDLRPFGVEAVLQGFIDRRMADKTGVEILDFKTGAEKKKEFYASDDYRQTIIYAYSDDLVGNVIKGCGVMLFPRKGNGSEKHPVRLEGKPIYIDNHYSRQKAEKALKSIAKAATEISDYYKEYLKHFKDEA
jgi:hypothetical protein